ncbi:hypothetical protein C0992_007504, partial [Termitomyces sp. T32_za158]
MPELRASSRLKNKAISSIAAHHSPVSVPQKVQRKRCKVAGTLNKSNTKCEARTNRRGIQGKLKLVVEMPLDILFEIFSFLRPADLLCLSRANKVLRGILLNRKTNYIWKGHARQCEEWVNDMKQRREKKIQDILSKRKEVIFERLRQDGLIFFLLSMRALTKSTIGWSDELDYLYPWGIGRIPEIDKVQELTENAWAKIYPRIKIYFEGVRLTRLGEQRRNIVQRRMVLLMPLYQEYLSTLPHLSRVPGFPDLCAEEPFRSLIFSTPIDTTLTPADFAAHKDDIVKASRAQSESQVQLLEALLPPDYPSLDLAKVFFNCQWCRKSISYPSVLQHHCLIERHDNFKPSRDNAELYKFALDHKPWDYHGSYNQAEYALLFRRPWNFGGLQVKYDEEAAGEAKAIIVLCGADPDDVSKNAMDELDIRVECLRCGHGKRGRTGRLAMTWSVAVTHEFEKHRQGEEGLEWEGPRWKLLDAVDLEVAKSKELR